MFISCFPQTWFEKQRTLNPEHREEPMSLSGARRNEGPPPAAQWQYRNLAPPPVSFSNPCWDALPAPRRSQAFVPRDPFGVFGSHVPSTVTMQAPEVGQQRQNPDAPLTYTNRSPEQPMAGQGFPGAQAPFYPQPDAQRENQHSEDPDDVDISYIMQWWDKGRLDLIARWNPLKET